tara:strand:- start:1584 stop:2825 length:1242 start_codon:yes stop_codon:yes gene_type:complete
MPESLENQFISDLYTSLLHLSGAELTNKLNKVFDGVGNSTGLALSGDRVIINNYIYPKGYATAVDWLDAFWPIGSVKLTFNNQNPGDYLQPPRNTLVGQDSENFPGIAGTRWEQVAQGRFLVGVGEDEVKGIIRDFCPGGKEEEREGLRLGSGDVAGEYEVQLTESHLPAHNHETNIGTNSVQVRSDVGSGGVLFRSDEPGVTNASQAFDIQQRARNTLLNNLFSLLATWQLDNAGLDLSFSDSRFGNLAPITYGLDLNFTRGSARNYSAGQRAVFENVQAYKAAGGTVYDNNDDNWPNFKEMIGIWNGETRFVANLNTTGRLQGAVPNGVAPRSSNPYLIAKELGAIDYEDAVSGQFVSQFNETPTFSGDEYDVSERVEGSTNLRTSTFVGENEPHNNIPPSYGVYVWRRVA